MSKNASWIQTIIFAAFITIVLMLFITIPDKNNSEQENRELSQMPELSFSALFYDDFTGKFETYISDQFPFRDKWITVKARCELLSGKKENKGVFLCEGDTLIEAYSEPDYQLLDTNIKAVKNLADNIERPVFFALIPGPSEVNSPMLPKNAPNYSQKEIIDYCYKRSGAINIDILNPLLLHSDEYIYYRTDHHWTGLGAYYGYEALMGAMGYSATPLSSYNSSIISDEFYGTTYSKSGITWVKPDTIEIFAEEKASTQVVNYVSGDSEKSSMYEYDHLDKKNKYAVFMGGISPLISITTENTDAPSLLIVRDSYIDSLAPYLQNNFSEIYLMDIRYYKAQLMQSSIRDFINDNQIDEVLICYSVNNFSTDNNVFLLGM